LRLDWETQPQLASRRSKPLDLDACPALSHPVLRPNRMLVVCVPRNQVYTHTVHKMEYRITNVSIYIIYYMNNVLHKTKSNTLKIKAVEQLHSLIGNQPGAIAHLKLLIEVLQFFFIF
jgi:hypothetical protein